VGSVETVVWAVVFFVSELTYEQRDLIFDYCLGLASPPEEARATQLLAWSDQAADLHATIATALAPLEHVSEESCPDELADYTVQRLCELARQHTVSMPPEVIKLQRSRNLSNVIAVAASILIVVGILVPSSKLMRHRYNVRVCQGQMGNVARGLELYSADHDDVFPALPRTAGAPWNQVGYQGPENHSNTRNLFTLLRLRYVDDPADFVCCGRSQKRTPHLTASTISDYVDFPSREHITYSYRIMFDSSTKTMSLAPLPLMADMNPHFEQSPATGSTRCGFPVAEEPSNLNSRNHGRRGQNVLYGDSHVRYVRTRIFGDPPDDIYTTEDKDVCQGYELPCSLRDTLLAP